MPEITPPTARADRQAPGSRDSGAPAPVRRRTAAGRRAVAVASVCAATALSAAACHVPGTSGAAPASPASAAPTATGPPAASGGGAAQPAAAGLTSRGPVHGFTVEVPRGWKHKNETYPSDHTTDVFYDAADPARRLVLINSGCTGCAGENKRSALNVLPQGAFNTKVMGPDAAAYQIRHSQSDPSLRDNPYLGNGVAYIPKNASRAASGYATAEVFLPDGQHELASAILNSVQQCWC